MKEGSGVVIGMAVGEKTERKHYVVLTAGHVVPRANRRAHVWFGGKWNAGTVIASESTSRIDAGLILVPATVSARCIELAEMSPEGGHVILAGYPGLKWWSQETYIGDRQETYLVLNAPSSVGASGGGVISCNELVAIISASGGDFAGQTVAHDVRVLRPFVERALGFVPRCGKQESSAPPPPGPPGPEPDYLTREEIIALIKEHSVAPKPGPKGDRGPQGPPGPPGRDGATPTIDYDKLAEEVLKRLPPPREIYFEIKPRTRK